MKKLLACLLALTMLIGLSMSVSAAEVTFKDTLEDNYPLVFEKSDNLRFENNADLEVTLYGKWGLTAQSAVKETAYMTYKLNGSVTGVSVDVMLCNGLGDVANDISIFLSKDNKNWTALKTKYTEPVFDEDIYINLEKAYWLMSTVSNASACPSGYNYVKIVLNPYTNKDSANWNTMLNTVTIKYSGTAATSKPATSKPSTTSKPAASKAPAVSATTSVGADVSVPETESGSVAEVSETTSVEELSETVESGSELAADTSTVSENTENKKQGSLLWLWIVLGVVVVLGIGVGVFFALRARENSDADADDTEDPADEQ